MLRRLRFNVRPGSAAAALAVAVEAEAGAALPTEIRLFAKGWNDTEHGPFLFDDEAFAATKAAYEKWGVDRMIDLEHLSLDPESTNYDPDAYGWCKLEFRDDGSCWMVQTTWTEDGAARLTKKTQRFVSPAFSYDTESKRITSILNIAITALPATHNAQALVAASVAAGKVPPPRDLRKLSTGPSFDNVRSALSKALHEHFAALSPEWKYCGPWIVDVFDASIVFDVDGVLYEMSYAFDGTKASFTSEPAEVVRTYTPVAPPAATAPAQTSARSRASLAEASRKKTAKTAVGKTSMDPKLIRPAIEAIKNKDSDKALEILEGLLVTSAGGDEAPPDAAGEKKPADDKAPPADGKAAAAPAPAEDDKKKEEPMAAAGRMACALTGKADPGEAIAELTRRSKIAVEVEQREAQLSTDRATLEATERRQLVGKLVHLRAETPATAWGDEAGTVPCERLQKEPIDELRARVAKLGATPGLRTDGTIIAPATSEVDALGLTADQRKICDETGCKPEAFAALNKAYAPAAPR